MYIEHNSYMLAKQVTSAENKRQSNTDEDNLTARISRDTP